MPDAVSENARETGQEPGFLGYVDTVVENRIAGWAVRGGMRCAVDLLIDGAWVSTVTADQYRADLVGVASADGRHAFVLNVPSVFCDGTERTVEIRLAGTEQLLKFGRIRFRHVFSYRSPAIVVRPSPHLGTRVQSILSMLRTSDVAQGRYVRRGRANDGGYVMLDHGLDGAICYSLGINDDVSWDLEMAEAGCEIFQYDHTIDGLPFPHFRFHWFKLGIASKDSADGVFRTLDGLIAGNGHAGRTDLVLKMDIEGHEWEMLEALPEGTLGQFSQIVAELHGLSLVDDYATFAQINTVLRKLEHTHRLVHLHANNCGLLAVMGGAVMADTVEVTYVRRVDHAFTRCRRIFPTGLDMPCSPEIADFFLGPIGSDEE